MTHDSWHVTGDTFHVIFGGVSILSKLQLPNYNGFEAMMNMNEYKYIKKIINLFVEHLWLLGFVIIWVFECPSNI